MKLFIKENSLNFSFQIGLVCLALLLIWLDGYRSSRLVLYIFVLALFLTSLFYGYRYYKQKKFYQKLSDSKEIYDELNELSTPVGKELDALFARHHQKYYQETTTLKKNQQQQHDFMDLWIHQMKTPLAVIELLSQEPTIDVESLREETDRLKEGLMQALTMSRIQNLREDFVIRPLRISEVAKEVIQEHKQNLIRSHVYPKLDMSPTIQVQSDQKWLHFILYQLLSNAIKYSKEEATVTIYGEQRADGFALIVKDQGIGIPSSDLPKIFQPFFTGENGRKQQEATGMGLYLSEKAATELGLALKVESQVGAGTSIAILFTDWIQLDAPEKE
ncbi:hypothetical protein BAU15_07775 [Enterococcus sp. JM4C]|uniref:sensor histidine kinase n=1 Tax=Candidatus Enterococcus huntleyi TaxID=1857217 RepID=UPI00137A684E|nr:sensor histidine kinase [Enterococcus sp. JM4C]KAF1297601.1 hypothetical protein BAU15_07775 [Enterococcus sp. JM4C]